jgi:hypothetical protein
VSTDAREGTESRRWMLRSATGTQHMLVFKGNRSFGLTPWMMAAAELCI